MTDDYDINDLDARTHARRQLSTICRYSLAALCVLAGALALCCEPHGVCKQRLADSEVDAAEHEGRADECRRWTP